MRSKANGLTALSKPHCFRLPSLAFAQTARRPPSHVPFFNGNLFKKDFSEEFLVGDGWRQDFLGELSADESPYLFNQIPVEILSAKVIQFHRKSHYLFAKALLAA